jgi:hypothetical protein
LTTTPGAPRSIKKLAMASMLAAAVCSERWSHESRTTRYATAPKVDQLNTRHHADHLVKFAASRY